VQCYIRAAAAVANGNDDVNDDDAVMQVDEVQLRQIASPDTNKSMQHYFFATNFGDLERIITVLVNSSCIGIPTTPTTTTTTTTTTPPTPPTTTTSTTTTTTTTTTPPPTTTSTSTTTSTTTTTTTTTTTPPPTTAQGN